EWLQHEALVRLIQREQRLEAVAVPVDLPVLGQVMDIAQRGRERLNACRPSIRLRTFGAEDAKAQESCRPPRATWPSSGGRTAGAGAHPRYALRHARRRRGCGNRRPACEMPRRATLDGGRRGSRLVRTVRR